MTANDDRARDEVLVCTCTPTMRAERRRCEGCIEDDTLLAAPVDWPARFRTAAEVASDARLYYALHGVGAGLHGLADTDPGQVEAIVRVLLGEDGR